MPCSPNDISINIPPGPSGPAIPGFGQPFALPAPNFSLPFPENFPEDLLEIFNLLQFILPSGIINPALNPNFGKDIFDGIMKLLDQFFPFLMLYKFFLPILDMIICVIEIICALTNPIKLISKIKRLFRTCIPAFLSLFPIFALILMIISLLLLILALIEYIINQILKLIQLLLRNINTITKALALADASSVLAAVKKLGLILCSFQNLFVLFAIFKAIIDIIKDILKLFFKIPPCDDGNNGDADKCCGPDVCPSFIRNNETLQSTSGTLQYFNEVSVDSGLILPPSFGAFTFDLRKESWQFFDPTSSVQNAFINITKAFDLPPGITTVFFPTDAVYTASTPPSQAPYLVDVRLFYNPAFWGVVDPKGARFIRVNNCVVLNPPTINLLNYNNNIIVEPTGVLNIAGGSAFEDDGTTPITIGGNVGSLNNLIHLPARTGSSPVLLPTDGYEFQNVSYTFKIQHEVLLGKALITLGCIPAVSFDRDFVNTTFAGNAGVKFALLNAVPLPDLGAAQTCLATALAALRLGVSAEAVATFQAATTVCLNNLSADTTNALTKLVEIGFDQYKSSLTLSPTTQFTTQPITVSVILKETNGFTLTPNAPASIGQTLSSQIIPTITFGKISDFSYDGYSAFTADITSDQPGNGTIMVAFQGQTISTITVPTDITQPPSIAPVVLPYTFIYTPKGTVAQTGTGDTDGKPRFDETDVADNSGN